MLKIPTKFILIYILVLFLSGCAFTTSQISLDYHPAKTVASCSSKTITLGKFDDMRDDDPKLLAYKRNGFNAECSGKYLAERPIADILHDSFDEALKNANYRIVAKQSDFTLSGKITDITTELRQGLFVENLETSIKVSFKLVKNRTGNVVWTDIISGNSNIDTDPIYIVLDEWYRKSFNMAMDNLIKKLLTSSDFQQAVSR
jgi:hypothetical protein